MEAKHKFPFVFVLISFGN